MGMYCEVSAAANPHDQDDSSPDPNILSGFFGAKTATGNSISLEKAWHGLHYLLTGEVWQGTGPLAFLLAGGEPVDGDEESGVRWCGPAETQQIRDALANVTDEQLWSRFDADELEQREVYPGIWDEPEGDLQQEYLEYFHALKQVVAAAAKNGQGLIVSIG